jgi:glycosyltransferase involved in cell wall biosynthesis
MRVFYVCNWNGQSGGIKVIYDHLQSLRRLGIDAYLGSYGEFQRCDWFAHDPDEIPSVSHLLEQVGPLDLVVAVEVALADPELEELPCPLVAFVQNPDLMRGQPDPARHLTVIVPSEPLVGWIREGWGYAGTMHVVPGFIEAEYLTPLRAQKPERPRHLVIDRPGKNKGEAAKAARALEEAGLAVSKPDRYVTRDEFVALFRENDVYLHLSYREGFPVSILEAFASSALVVGFAGTGGLQFMHDGDWEAVVERVLALQAMEPAAWSRMLSRAHETASSWTRERMENELREAYRWIRAALAGKAPR